MKDSEITDALHPNSLVTVQTGSLSLTAADVLPRLRRVPFHGSACTWYKGVPRPPRPNLFQGRVFPEQAATPFRFSVWIPQEDRRLWRRCNEPASTCVPPASAPEDRGPGCLGPTPTLPSPTGRPTHSPSPTLRRRTLSLPNEVEHRNWGCSIVRCVRSRHRKISAQQMHALKKNHKRLLERHRRVRF